MVDLEKAKYKLLPFYNIFFRDWKTFYTFGLGTRLKRIINNTFSG